MAAKADFSEEEWTQLLEAPPSAGLVIIASDRGGSIRETFSMAKSYAEAHQKPGQSELIDEIVSAKPQVDHTRFKTKQEMREHSLQNVREAVALLKSKAGEDEVEAYRQFVLALVNKVAEARKEGFMGLRGERVSDDEKAAIEEVTAALA
jgi:hypothetical protein